MSLRRQDQIRLALEIRRNGVLVPVPCDRCFSSNSNCIALANMVSDKNSRLKCSECTRLGRPCVNLSWQSLDKTREEYKKKIEDDEKLLMDVMARLMRNKKILKQAEDRAAKKLECLANEMRESGEEVDAEDPLSLDCPGADALVGLSPAVWSTLAALDDFGAPSGVVTGV